MPKRVLIGKRNGVPGFFVSRSGEDVETASVLLLDSTSDLTKPFLQGRITSVTWINGRAQRIDIPHPLGYVPYFMLRGEGVLPTNSGSLNMGEVATGNFAWPRITTAVLYLQLTVGNHAQNNLNATYTFNFPSGVYLEWAIYEMRMI